ncbi:MAG TPA: DUF262 domain-containing protein [Thermoanaerobaculia bacterium]|nr:DUF262 domain-containing protein [Thermoanaerobaculia bacterium]
MASLDQIRINLEGIAHVLSDNRLKVPAFQRSYAWETSHVTDLLQDVTAALKSGDTEYFLGSVVVSTENAGMLEVVDGQQRLATVTLILAQIRDYFLVNQESERASTLENDFLLKRDLRTQEAVPRLILNDIDHNYFQSTVLTRPGSPERMLLTPSRTSHRLIRDACEIARKHILAITSTSRTPIDALVDYIEYLNGKAKVILVQVPDHANAFTIFETLNDRGIDLAISDLLKNYLFYRAENRIAEVQASWAAMLGALTAVDTDASLVDYIRHYWSSRNGATRERDLYTAIRKRISSKQAAVDLARGLEVAARHYAAVLSPAHELWNEYGISTRQHVETINLLRMVQVRPLLLAVLKKFSASEAKKAFRLIVAWGVRFLVHGGLGGGVLEDNYCERAKSIHAGSITSAKQLASAMTGVVPTDKAFESAFATASVAQAYLARYYLRALEKQAQGQAQPELVPNANEEEINLEHVLPLKPEGNWPEFDEDTARAVQRRIGNLVLLKQKLNASLKSAPFNKKRVALASSQYALTKEVGKISKWGAAAIATRQQRLAKLAVSAWPIKVT